MPDVTTSRNAGGESPEPRDVAARLERAPRLPDGTGERFRGYGVVGLPLASGHVLALRRYTASSIGPAYTCVWLRDPDGRWTFYADAPPNVSCARFFGADGDAAAVDRITVTWTGPRSFTAVVDGARLAWAVHLRPTARSRVLSAAAASLPERLWHDAHALAALGAVAGRTLDVGQLRLAGRAPSGHHFRVAPRGVWPVDASTVLVDGESLGPQDGGAAPQSRLGDFWIPRRGLFVVWELCFDDGRHAGGGRRVGD